MDIARIYLAMTLLDKSEVKIPQAQLNVNSVIITVFSIIGGVALIIIILAGIKFIASQGNPDGVAKARNTIIYAAIGLAVSVSALTIVTFVADSVG